MSFVQDRRDSDSTPPRSSGVLPLGWTKKVEVYRKNEICVLVDGLVRYDGGYEVSRDESQSESHLANLPRLYEKEGLAFLRKLRGSFCLALWNSNTRRLLLATDHFGTRPMYYWHDADTLAFSPRIACLSSFPKVPTKIDSNILFFYLNHSFVPAPYTIYAGIRRLEPGQALVWENGRVTLQQYWDMTYEEERTWDETIAAVMLHTAVEESVRFLLRNDSFKDEERGAFLSGGTDSSTLLGLMSGLTGTRTHSFSVGFTEEQYNEIHYARIAAKHFNSQAHEHFVRPNEALEAISSVAQQYDEPFGNSSAIPTYFCLKTARDAGVKAMFAGDGGDELFAGNERYVTEKVFSLYHRLPSPFRKLTDVAIDAFPAVYPWTKLRNYVHKANQPAIDRFFSYQLYFQHTAEEFFTGDFRAMLNLDFPLEVPRQHYLRVLDVSPLNRLLYVDLKLAIADNDLFKVNRMAESQGIQIRYPYLDFQVAAVSCKIASQLKLKGWTKRYIFKKAFADLLPKEILQKKKHGFGLPIGHWLRTDPGFRELARSLLLEPRSWQRGYFKRQALEKLLHIHDREMSPYYGSQIWNLMMLELWHRNYADNARGNGTLTPATEIAN